MSDASKDSDTIISSPKDITGIILAGGKSLRYGKNKALVEVGGTRLIERVISVIRPLFENLIIITNTPREYDYLQLPMREDIIKGLGPLGGVYTGLETISDESGFFVACDMPFIQGSLIRYMVEIRDDFDAVVPKIDWKIEPLHAIYTKNCLPAIEKLIDARGYQIIEIFDNIRVRYVKEEEIRSFDSRLKSFLNVNSPRELAYINRLEGE
ncbi:MAG: molybdenum cofactor guanylyltransferase [Deltaproteobacteria bacterium]|nr:molybdenum cofactor guanylyltransferase [Deltaproteobacteria bacterium]